MAREPLVDLPLERFYPTRDDRATSTPSTSLTSKRAAQKRSLSPSGPLLLPAKRRMLVHGNFGSTFRTRSPLSDFAVQHDSTSILPLTLERKLEPATLISAGGEENTASVAVLSRPTRTSPRIAARHASPSSSTRRNPHTPSLKASSPSLSRETSPLPMMVARPRQATPDHSSEDYPGFDIHYDTYIQLATTRSLSSGAFTKPPSRSEVDKENARPKRSRRSPGAAGRKGGMESAPRRSPRLSSGDSDVTTAIDG